MTSSTEPEVRVVLQRGPEKNRATAIVNKHKNLVKFGRVVSKIYERTDRHTDRLITILRTPLDGEIKMRTISTSLG